MNPPQVYMCSPPWILLPPPSQYHPSGSSQCTSPKHPVSCIDFTILYQFCQILKWIRHRYTCVSHPEPSSLLPPHTLPLGCPSGPAPAGLYIFITFYMGLSLGEGGIAQPHILLSVHEMHDQIYRDKSTKNLDMAWLITDHNVHLIYILICGITFTLWNEELAMTFILYAITHS